MKAAPRRCGAAASNTKASASSTTGRPAAAPITPANKALPQSFRPNPGPHTMASAPANCATNSAPTSAPRTISSGQPATTAVACSARVNTVTRPAPQRSAASPAKRTAPGMPTSPPTTTTCPCRPLWASRARRGKPASVCRGNCHSRGCASSANAAGGTPSVCRRARPANPGFKNSPAFQPTKVLVNSARTAAPNASPELASMPDGTSMDSTGLPAALTASITSAQAPTTGRDKPVPNNASTTISATANAAGNSAAGRATPPTACQSCAASKASPDKFSGAAKATNETHRPAARANVATS